ncbi:MAG: hypothetical protein QM749_15580 [Aquabacterium sp.]
MRIPFCVFGASAVLASTMLTACGSFPQQPARYTGLVQAVEAEDVTPCKYIGSLYNSSGLTGLFAPKGVDNIKNTLLRQADAMGATHVVWDKAMAGYDSTSLTGKAYSCPVKPEK